MNLRSLGLCVFLLVVLALAAASIVGPVPGAVSASVLAPSYENESDVQQYLIPLHAPDPASIQVPPGMMPWHAGWLAQTLIAEQAEPLMRKLDRLAAQGKVSGSELRPELNAVEVTAGGSLPEMASLAGLARGEVPVTADAEGEACTAATAAALEEVVRSRIEAQLLASLAPAVSARTNPSIDLYLAPGASAVTIYSYVYGSTDPQVPVGMHLVRAGQSLVSASTMSDATGAYAFYPSYGYCSTTYYDEPQKRTYQWALQLGDVVEITAAGRTVSTVVTALSAWMDPIADVVAGSTGAGRSVEIVASQSEAQDRCSSSTHSQTVSSEADGSFSASWGGQVNFDHSAMSRICARDAVGNGPCAMIPAFHLSFSPLTRDPNRLTMVGQVKPGAQFTARLVRAGALVAETSGQATPGGYVRATFGSTWPKPGDVAQISSGGISMEYTVSSLSASLDHEADALTGQAQPGRQVRATFVRRGLAMSAEGLLPTSCQSATGCGAMAADASGSFDRAAPFDIVRGDYVSLTAYDEAGNSQESLPVNALAIYTDQTLPSVGGYWAPPEAVSLSVRVYSSSNVLKTSSSAVVEAWDGSFRADFSSSFGIAPGDRVEVQATNSASIESMTVQALSARLERETGRLTGATSGGRFIVVPATRRCDPALSGVQAASCVDQNLTAGSYDLDFPDLQFSGGDSADVYVAGPDGHYTATGPDTFWVRSNIGDDFVYGHTETKGSSVTATLWRSGIQQASCTSYSWGWWWACFLTGATISPGDTLHVKTTDGDEVSLLIPELTAKGADAPARLYGKSPANQSVFASVWEEVRVWWNNRYRTTSTTPSKASGRSDSGGNYSIPFAGLRSPATMSASICLPVRPSSPCSNWELDYCYPEGHQLTASSPYTSTPGPDAYEGDDIQSTARHYTSPQHHSFDSVDDVDWVKFEVPQDHVTDRTSYAIGTFNLASGALHDMTLYQADGQNVVQQWRVDSPEGQPSLMAWSPQVAGTYYLRIARPAGVGEIFCGDVYGLSIRAMTERIYLPLVLR